jgi:hypothetical protein
MVAPLGGFADFDALKSHLDVYRITPLDVFSEGGEIRKGR